MLKFEVNQEEIFNRLDFLVTLYQTRLQERDKCLVGVIYIVSIIENILQGLYETLEEDKKLKIAKNISKVELKEYSNKKSSESKVFVITETWKSQDVKTIRHGVLLDVLFENKILLESTINELKKFYKLRNTVHINGSYEVVPLTDNTFNEALKLLYYILGKVNIKNTRP